jgi:5-methyltetrahydrofolate--homocysteine methyltransferase
MKRIEEQVREGRILVSDGAWGTFLQKKGLRPGDCPELWCVERRADVLDVARSYVAAGADMIETNSFGGTRFKLEFYGLADRVEEINRAAAAISREAAGPDRHVIASIGPTGKMLLAGDVTEEQMAEAFREQALALEAGGADACCIETMSALDEACLTIQAVRRSTGLEIICTFTFEKTTRGEYRTMMGVSPAEMAEALPEAGARIIGANCGHGIAQMIEVVKEIRAAAPEIPILVHPNAGMPRQERNGVVFPETPEEMAGKVPALIEAGANIIGGCCGTTPAHIEAMAKAVRRAAGAGWCRP